MIKVIIQRHLVALFMSLKSMTVLETSGDLVCVTEINDSSMIKVIVQRHLVALFVSLKSMTVL